jgi:signal transduction histidine kinase
MVIGAISHDLRTYLTRLRLRLELLPDSDQRTKASSDVEGMQALIDDALAFARSSFERGDEKVADLACLLQQECESRKADGQAVSLTDADAPLWVRGSPGAVARVVANLVGNAIAYGQCAELSLTRRGDFAELCVEDRGPGIPVADRENVFEPFHRLEPSRSRAHGGAGLGLAIVRQIVEGYRGTIEIEDRSGGGARIRVRLPCGDLAGNAVVSSSDRDVSGDRRRAYRPSTA